MTRVLGVLIVLIAVAMAAIAAGNFGFGPVVITREDEQKLVLLLGRVRVVTSPGASLRIPLLEEVETYDARWLHLGTQPLPIQTRDGEQLPVDNYVLWRISARVTRWWLARTTPERAEAVADTTVAANLAALREEARDLVVRDAAESVGEPCLLINAIQLGGVD